MTEATTLLIVCGGVSSLCFASSIDIYIEIQMHPRYANLLEILHLHRRGRHSRQDTVVGLVPCSPAAATSLGIIWLAVVPNEISNQQEQKHEA